MDTPIVANVDNMKQLKINIEMCHFSPVVSQSAYLNGMYRKLRFLTIGVQNSVVQTIHT